MRNFMSRASSYLTDPENTYTLVALLMAVSAFGLSFLAPGGPWSVLMMLVVTVSIFIGAAVLTLLILLAPLLPQLAEYLKETLDVRLRSTAGGRND